MGDKWAVVDELLQVRGSALLRFAYLLRPSGDEAHDLLQEALTRVLSKRLPDTPGELERYLRRVMVNLVTDQVRRGFRWRRLIPTLATPDSRDDSTFEVCRRLDIEQALAALPAGQRTCVVLRYYEDRALADIARELGCSVGSVKRQLHDARAALARTWTTEKTTVPGRPEGGRA